MHVEDLIPGKHFTGHKDRLCTVEQAADRIKAMADARTDSDFVIIARSDAIGVTSLDDAIQRATAYAEAGADLLFLPYLRLEDTRQTAEALPKPLLNVVIDTPKAELEAAGLKVAIYPVQSLFSGLCGRPRHAQGTQGLGRHRQLLRARSIVEGVQRIHRHHPSHPTGREIPHCVTRRDGRGYASPIIKGLINSLLTLAKLHHNFQRCRSQESRNIHRC